MNKKQLNELLLQSLEHERGGIAIYETALECVVNDKLRDEWSEYLEQTREHERILRKSCAAMGIDAETETPGRSVVRHVGEALVAAMQEALAAGPPAAAELVACECVVLAETKDHANWQLIGKCADALDGGDAQALRSAYDEVEDQEDEHLYHTRGWCRELWVQSLGLKAVLPPPEERLQVKTAIGAARAEQAGELAR
jgi:hypothetical protein